MKDSYILETERIAVIEEYLSKENSGKLADSMSWDFKEELIKIFCNSDDVTHLDIVGYFADDAKLGSSILSVINEKPSKSGVLFLKDRFYYRKGMFSTPVQMSYDDIRYVDEKIASLVLYSDPSFPVTLSGISYSEVTSMPTLFASLRNLNEDTIEVTRADKIQNFARKALENTGKVIDFMMAEAQNQQVKNQKMLEKMSRDSEHILSNPNAYSREEVAKAAKFQRAMEKRTQEVCEILSNPDQYSSSEVREAKSFNNLTGVYYDEEEEKRLREERDEEEKRCRKEEEEAEEKRRREEAEDKFIARWMIENGYGNEDDFDFDYEYDFNDEDEYDYEENTKEKFARIIKRKFLEAFIILEDPDQYSEKEVRCATSFYNLFTLISEQDDAEDLDDKEEAEETESAESTDSAESTESIDDSHKSIAPHVSPYQGMYDRYLENPIYLENQHLKDSDIISFTLRDNIWQYLRRNYDRVSEHFFTDAFVDRPTYLAVNAIVKDACYLNMLPSGMIGFSEKGIHDFDAGFVMCGDSVNAPVLHIKESGKKVRSIPLTQITKITPEKSAVQINDSFSVSTASSPFESETVANVLNYYVVSFQKKEGLLKDILNNSMWTCKCGKRNENSFNFCPNCGSKKE